MRKNDKARNEPERTKAIERRQDFPGAVITGYNDDVPPDYTPIRDEAGPDHGYAAELPYRDDPEEPPPDAEA